MDLTDADIGDLWNKVKLPLVRQLIIKLVRERNNINDDWGLTFVEFKIDPQSFPMYGED